MTTAGDVNTAISAVTTCMADIVPQAVSAANAASAAKLQAAQNALTNTVLPYLNDVKTLVVGF